MSQRRRISCETIKTETNIKFFFSRGRRNLVSGRLKPMLFLVLPTTLFSYNSNEPLQRALRSPLVTSEAYWISSVLRSKTFCPRLAVVLFFPGPL